MKKFFLMLLLPLIGVLSSQAQVNDTVAKNVVGRIIFKSGNVVKMQVAEGKDLPGVDTQGELSKSFNTTFLGAQVTGWMSIGKMKVTAVSNDIVTFTLLEELSVITENGVKKNHFEIGNEVKFVW